MLPLLLTVCFLENSYFEDERFGQLIASEDEEISTEGAVIPEPHINGMLSFSLT